MADKMINLQPDPRILIAITHNPMRPMDALCELIDNAIDSYTDGIKLGVTIDSPTIMISVPKPSDIEKGGGSISVLDNGPGLTLSETQNALRAGFTSRNPVDTLGLFGMGFNISTGKLGKRTLFRTAKIKRSEMIEVTIDLEEMVKTHAYDVPVFEISKDPPNFHGTLVQISEWWSQGSQNFGFASKLARLGVKGIREEIGRRYYPILRDQTIRIFVNDELCQPFEHCVWADRRAINHHQHGTIPAIFRFDKSLQTRLLCTNCSTFVVGTECQHCGSAGKLRTVEERVSGWVGIQRFDDANDYGIDLIRRGRVIKKWEKEAFFTWTDSYGRQVRDYPIDSPYGRIVGEVHLDGVPTDFLKQDFQRTSPEWIRALDYLRGESSLQPKIAADAGEAKNDSPVYLLYQGYRRVRDYGTKDMYMGYWEPGQDRPKRISRETEREYYDRFLKKEPGFYDDAEWWKLVEQADSRPPENIKQCPTCAFQCLESAETCPGCGYIFLSKTCINRECGVVMALSTNICPTCGAEQVIRPQDRWKCSFCSRLNPPSAGVCLNCGHKFGEVNPFSLDFLLSHSNKDDDLSIQAFSIPLPGGVSSGSFNVDVYILQRGIVLERGNIRLPSVTIKEEGSFRIFIDASHPFFTEYQQNLETIISMETAKYIQDANARYMTGDEAHLWSLPSLCWQISRIHWQEALSIDPDRIRRDTDEFFGKLRQALPDLLADKAKEIYEAMTPTQQGTLVQTIVQNGFDAREVPSLVKSGTFLSFLDNRSIVKLIENYPGCFFDGKFWSDAYENIPIENSEATKQIEMLILSKYRNFLEDILSFLEFKQVKQQDNAYNVRANHTLDLLTKRMVR